MNNQIKTWAREDGNPLFHISIPRYLEETYWWAYVHPNAVAFFERQWLVNLILLGNFARLRDATLNQLGREIRGRILQIACVYGDFSIKLAERLMEGGSMDIVDVLPIQLENTRRKVSQIAPIQTMQSDSSHLKLADASYDQAVMFFLLHEMPAGVREKSLQEALRVLKPGGKLVITDYHKPHALNPLRYLYPLMFRLLEPFALDIWKQQVEEWLPSNFSPAKISKQTFFGGLYQNVVITKQGGQINSN